MADAIVPRPAVFRVLPACIENRVTAGGRLTLAADAQEAKHEARETPRNGDAAGWSPRAERNAREGFDGLRRELAGARAVTKVATEEAEHWRATAAVRPGSRAAVAQPEASWGCAMNASPARQARRRAPAALPPAGKQARSHGDSIATGAACGPLHRMRSHCWQ